MSTAEDFVGVNQILDKLKEQNFCCAISGVELTPETAGLDHIVPVSLGGTHSIDNIQIVHRSLNDMKGTLTMDEFVSWCQKVARAFPEMAQS